MTHPDGSFIQRYSAEAIANDDDPELRAVVRQGIEAALERGDVVRVGIDGEVGPPTSLCGAVDTAPTPTIPDGLCGFFIGDRDGGTGACVFLPHPLGTPHSWAPPLPKQRPGETIRDAERRERMTVNCSGCREPYKPEPDAVVIFESYCPACVNAGGNW